MDDGQLLKILDALKPSNEPVEVKHDIFDSISKVGVALCAAGIMWVGGQIQSQDKKLIEIETNQRHLSEEVKTFADFTKVKRFTHDDFVIEMRDYQNRLERLEEETYRK